MDDDLVKRAFELAITDEPPLAVTTAEVRRAGRGRLHRRRVLVATGTVAALGLAGAGTVAGLRAGTGDGPGPGSPPVGLPVALVPFACGTLYVPDGTAEGPGIPDVVVAAQRVLTAAPVLAPGRSFAVAGTTRREDGAVRGLIRFGIGLAGHPPPGPPSAGAPPEPVLEPSTADLTILAEQRAGATPAEQAAAAATINRATDCPPPERITFTDGAEAVVTGPFLGFRGRGRAVMRTLIYFSPSGLSVTARVTQAAVVVGTDRDPPPSDGSPSPEPRYADTVVMALSPEEMLDLVRIVAGDG
jgi:hypothetical protein